MAILSQNEITALAQSVGFSAASARIASAVAMAESSGNTRALNMVGRDNSYGLWQINMLGAMGPERRAQYGLRSNEDLFDPHTNARVAYGISSGGTNWRPWTSYVHGTYKKYLTDAGAGASGIDQSGSGGVVTLPDSGQMSPALIAVMVLGAVLILRR